MAHLPHEYTSQSPCCICGLTTQTLHDLNSPFQNGIFDYSLGALSTARQIVEDGKTKVHALDEAIRKLQEHRDKIQRVVLDHQALLPPIARLPNDVMLLVFDQAMGWGWEPREGTLWAASAVCRRWRDLALSSKRIWSRIALDFHHQCSGSHDARALLACQRVQLQLERSGQESLQCALRFRDLDAEDDEDDDFEGLDVDTFIHTTIRRLLAALADRCVILLLRSICGAQSVFDPPDPYVDFPPMTRLRKLTMQTPYSGYHLFQYSFLASLPTLRELTFSSSPLPRALDIPPDLFATVTYLNIRSSCRSSPSGVIALLAATPNLKTLELHAFQYGPTSQIPPVANLPSLQNLRLFFPSPKARDATFNTSIPEDNHFIREVVRHLRVPNLETLQINRADGEDEAACIRACFSETSERASFIHEINLSNLKACTLPHIATLIARTPALQLLQLIQLGAENRTLNIDPLISTLTWPCQNDLAPGASEPEPGTRSCPQLVELVLHGCTLSEIGLDDMLHSRGLITEDEEDEEAVVVYKLKCAVTDETFTDSYEESDEEQSDVE